MSDTLKSFVADLEREGGIDHADFGLRPCSELGLKAREELGRFPESLSSLLISDFDGQDYGAFKTPLFGEFRLLPIADSLKHWQENHEEFGHQDSPSSDKRIQPGQGWRDLWYPFAWDGTMNRLLILDFDPSEKGTVGQVFLYDCHDTPGDWLAPSFPAFLSAYYQRLSDAQFERNGQSTFDCSVSAE